MRAATRTTGTNTGLDAASGVQGRGEVRDKAWRSEARFGCMRGGARGCKGRGRGATSAAGAHPARSGQTMFLLALTRR